jgi:hypothetical protein
MHPRDDQTGYFFPLTKKISMRAADQTDRDHALPGPISWEP